MNEQAIQEQYQHIVSLLEQKRLKEAQIQLEAFYGTVTIGLFATVWNRPKCPTNTCYSICARA